MLNQGTEMLLITAAIGLTVTAISPTADAPLNDGYKHDQPLNARAPGVNHRRSGLAPLTWPLEATVIPKETVVS